MRNAENATDSPVLSAITWVPVIGDQVHGLRSLADDIRFVADRGEQILGDVERALERTGEPNGKVELVDTAAGAVARLQRDIAGLTPIDDSRLVGPVRTAAVQLQEELDAAEADLDELRVHLESARDLLAGPTDVLVLAANNAEVRAGMGMHLSAGIITIENGEFETTPFFPTGPLRHVTEGRAAVPGELQAMFGEIWDFGREWRTTSTTPNFPVVGEIIADLANRTTIGEVDAVVSIDAPALAAILDASGPVDFEGRTISSDNVVDVLLRDNYLELGDNEQRTERRELQSDVAKRIFEVVTERDIDIIELAGNLADAAEGRHLLGWSDDPGIQSLWEAIGADGALSDNSFLVAFQNASASKRDYYIDPSVRVRPVETLADGSRRFRVDASLENPVIEPSTDYIDSLNRFVPVGVHRAYVTFTLPGAATDIEVISGRESRIGTDGPTALAAVWLRVPAGEEGTASIEFTVPARVRAVELLSSARVQPVTYEFGPVAVEDGVGATVPLPRVAELRPDRPDWVPAAALVIVFAALVIASNRARNLASDEPNETAARLDAQLIGAMLVFAAAIVLLDVAG